MSLSVLLSLALQGTPQLEQYRFGEAWTRYGSSLAALGDWDGDGVEDYAVGASGVDVLGLFSTVLGHGRVEIRSGATDALIAETGDLWTTVDGALGTEMVGGFDSDGDGFEELAVTASGRQEVLILERFSPSSSVLIPIATLTPIDSASLREEAFGACLANVGDFTGDGIDDLAIGSPESDRKFFSTITAEDAGAVRLVSGADWSTVDSWSFGDPGARFGTAIDDVKDMNGNATRDLAIGAPGVVNGSNATAGRVTFLDPGIVFPSPIINELVDDSPGDGFGTALLDVGDLTGGVQSELLVGSLELDFSFELVTVGPSSQPESLSLDRVAFGELALFELTSFQELWTRGGSEPLQIDPRGLALGDPDGDGQREVVTIEVGTNPIRSAVAQLNLLDGQTERSFESSSAHGRYSESDIAVGPDLNQDGREDVLFTTPALEFFGGGVFGLTQPPLVLPPQPQTLVVDGDPGSVTPFRGLSQALMVATPGSRIHIEPGLYGPAATGKELTLLGDPLEPSQVIALDLDPLGFLRLEELWLGKFDVRGAPFRLTFDRLRATQASVIDCADVTFHDSDLGPAATGLQVANSRVELFQSRLFGASAISLTPAPGFPALSAIDGSQVLAVESQFFGADGSTTPFGDPVPPGPAIAAVGSELEFRGGLDSIVQGGVDPNDPLNPAFDLETAATDIVLSGTFPTVSLQLSGGEVTKLEVLRPWIDYESQASLGSFWQVAAHAEAGYPGLLYVTLGSANVSSAPVVDVPIQVDAAQQVLLLPLVGGGFGAPATEAFPVPAEPLLDGLDLHVQAFFLQVYNDPLFLFDGTNGGAVQLRP